MASFIVVGVMATIAIGLLEPANLAVLFELKKPKPNGMRIARLMKVFIYTAGITGLMQVATLIIMTRVAIAMTTAARTAGAHASRRSTSSPISRWSS